MKPRIECIIFDSLKFDNILVCNCVLFHTLYITYKAACMTEIQTYEIPEIVQNFPLQYLLKIKSANPFKNYCDLCTNNKLINNQ